MYATYFYVLVKSSGTPNSSTDQFIRYQKSIAIEYFILKINSMGVAHTFYKELARHQENLDRLTKKLSPEDLIQEMLKHSYS